MLTSINNEEIVRYNFYIAYSCNICICFRFAQLPPPPLLSVADGRTVWLRQVRHFGTIRSRWNLYSSFTDYVLISLTFNWPLISRVNCSTRNSDLVLYMVCQCLTVGNHHILDLSDMNIYIIYRNVTNIFVFNL